MVLNVGDDLICLCRNIDGIYPVNATWYEGDKRIGDILYLKDVNSDNNNKNYKCVAQRYAFKDETSIRVFVDRKYI